MFFENKISKEYLTSYSSEKTIFSNEQTRAKESGSVKFLGIERFGKTFLAWFSNFGVVSPYNGESLLERQQIAKENNESQKNQNELEKGAYILLQSKLTGEIPEGYKFLAKRR